MPVNLKFQNISFYMEHLEILASITALGNGLGVIANLILILAFARWAYGKRMRTFVFTEDNGVKFIIKMKAEDVNASSLTNAVSTYFYGGGRTSNKVRSQIIEYTNPSFKGSK